MISLVITNNKGQNGTTIFNILDNTTELWMTKYIIGEIFSSGRATLYKNPSDQTVIGVLFIKGDVPLRRFLDSTSLQAIDSEGHKKNSGPIYDFE